MSSGKAKTKKLQFSDYDFIPIRKARLKKVSNEIIKISGHILQMDDSLYDKKDNLLSRALIADENKSMSTTTLTENYFKKLEKYQEKGNSVIILGQIRKIASSKKRGRFEKAIKIRDIKAVNSPLSVIQSKKKEELIVKSFLKTLSNKKLAVFEALKEATIAEYGIRLTGRKLLEKAIEVSIIQAFTCGRVENTSGKIHSLIIGGPGCGKKLVSISAKLLNIVGDSAQAGRITKAGLTADMSGKNADGTIRLNLIPKVNKGIAILQDFDKAPNKDELYPIISDVMEDGVCKVTGREILEMDAETAIHMDVNPKSSQNVSKVWVEGLLDDIGMDQYFLSRFDYISYLQKEKGPEYDPTPSRKSKIHKFIAGKNITFERFIKVLVACILDKYEKIDTSSVQRFKDKKFKELEESFDVEEVFSTYEERMKNSIIKFIEALTRLQLSKKSNKFAVNRACNYLADKMKLLEMLQQDSKSKNYRTDKIGFVQFVFDNFKDKIVSIKKIIKRSEEDGLTFAKVSEKTIYNWLNEFFDKIPPKKWKLKSKVITKLSR